MNMVPAHCGYRTRLFVLGLALLVLASGAARARAESALEAELGEVAKKLKDKLSKDDIKAVAIGDITGRANLAANGGPGIQKILAQKLQNLGVTIDANSKFEVKGDYKDFEDGDDKLLSVKLTIRLLDPNDVELMAIPRIIHGSESVDRVLGITGNFTPGGDAKQQSDERKQNLKDPPKVERKGARVRVSNDSPYAIEIHVKKNGKFVPREAEEKDGKTFVPLQRDEEFGVLLVNDSPFDAAVSLFLDGLSMFAFSENKDYQNVILKAKSQFLVEGWHLSNTKSAGFVVRDFPDTDPKLKLRDRAKLGVITACFSAAWEKDPEERPPDEAKTRAKFIDLGKEKKIDYKEVKRFVGTVRSTISVRYDNSVADK
jgi:hypothetical protein